MVLKEIPPKDKQETEAVCSSIIESVRAEISKEHSITLSCVVLLQPWTVPKGKRLYSSENAKVANPSPLCPEAAGPGSIEGGMWVPQEMG